MDTENSRIDKVLKDIKIPPILCICCYSKLTELPFTKSSLDIEDNTKENGEQENGDGIKEESEEVRGSISLVGVPPLRTEEVGGQQDATL